MKFVKSDNLATGMRLAKQIYNKNGVLLYDRGTKLTASGISNIKNFQLIGIYILEPTESLKPLTEEELQFEQRQTVYMFHLRTCFTKLYSQEKPETLQNMITDILKRYGSLGKQIYFSQNLRSVDDSIYKHAINSAIFCAMIAGQIGMKEENKYALVCAALLYDIGYLQAPNSIWYKNTELSDSDKRVLQQNLEKGLPILKEQQDSFPFFPLAFQAIKHYINYIRYPQEDLSPFPSDFVTLANILAVAVAFDEATAMSNDREPLSSLAAMEILQANPKIYKPAIVHALAQSIHITPAGASVDLSNGDRGIIVSENTSNYLQPRILNLRDYQVYDLSDRRVLQDVQLHDISPSMDMRIPTDENTIKQFHADERTKQTTAEFLEKRKHIMERGEHL